VIGKACHLTHRGNVVRRLVHCKSTDVSEEHVACIFRVEEKGKQEKGFKLLSSKLEACYLLA
jgi:hypothetical protein